MLYPACLAAFIMLVCICIASNVVPINTSAYADEGGRRIVKVGTVEQVGYALRDDDGVLRGFDAEFLSKVSQYAQFDVEYMFYSDFDLLLHALENGDVEMAVGISKQDNREARFLFSESKVGAGTLNLKVKPGDDRFEYGDVSQIASMKTGAIAGSIMVPKAREWAEENGISLDLKEYSGETELVDALYASEIDGAFVNDAVLSGCREILKIEAIDYFVAFNKGQMELRNLVDSAMNRIENEDNRYFENLKSKYSAKHVAPLVLTSEEKRFLRSRPNGNLSVAVFEEDPPFSISKGNTKTGIVHDYYSYLSEVISDNDINVEFTYIAYPNLEAAIKAVANGEADILGMTTIDATTAGQYGLVLTSPYSMQSIAQVSLPGTLDDTYGGQSLQTIRAAVLNSDKETFMAYLQNEKQPYYLEGKTTPEECYSALQNGEVDAVITSMIRANWLLNQHRSGTFVMTTITESTLPISAAVAPQNAILGAILSKASSNAVTTLDSIAAANTTPGTDMATLFNRLPVRVLITLIVLVIVVIGGAAFAINRALRNRDIRRKDIELIEAQQKLLQSYEHDSLTGLVSRDGALRRVKSELCDKGPYTMVVVSIDNIHTINETYGHGAGDAVMVEMANRLKRFCEEKEEDRVVYRYGMGVFLIVIKGRHLVSEGPQIKELEALARTAVSFDSGVTGGGETRTEIIRLQSSISAATSDGAEEPERIIRNCGIALEEAREDENRLTCFYTDNMQIHLERMNEVQDIVERAIEERLFYMLYQPQVDLSTREVSGYEALVRIIGGGATPDEFIPIAESKGLIRQIGRITTTLVVKQLAAWRDAGVKLHPVSINYFSMQIGDAGYVDYLLGLLEKFDIDSSLIKIEITERLFAREDVVTENFFAGLQQAGVQILLDDFGTGYSSLNYLAYIPVDAIKLDKSIIDAFLMHEGATNDMARSNDFVHNLVRLTHDLGKSIIAEGVEEKWQVDLLMQYGCDAIQGYYFSKPLEADDAAGFTPDFGRP